MRKTLFAILTLLTLTGCLSHDSTDDDVTVSLTEIVTFIDNTATGCEFEYIPRDAGVSSVFKADGTTIDTEKVKPGERMLISYVPQDALRPYKSGKITLKGYSAINTGDAEIVLPDDIKGWDTTPVYLVSIWQTGDYINIRSLLAYSEKPRRFALLADISTFASGHVRAYLAYSLSDGLTPSDTYSRANYASFSLAEIWQSTHVEDVTITVNNSNLTDQREFTFPRPH
ncbi:MAG: hypothetical protein HUK14_05015 [Muribaculaceae bacterium]|nr:hypothetical protein [Muribaculaceae bacterium]